MIDLTYDPEADAVYVSLARAKIAATDEIAPNIFVDREATGKIVGIEVLTASRVLASGEWQRAARPATADADAAE